MSRLQAAPVALGDKEYDPEIKDLADYIHKYKIDSDLAVFFPFLFLHFSLSSLIFL